MIHSDASHTSPLDHIGVTLLTPSSKNKGVVGSDDQTERADSLSESLLLMRQPYSCGEQYRLRILPYTLPDHARKSTWFVNGWTLIECVSALTPAVHGAVEEPCKPPQPHGKASLSASLTLRDLLLTEKPSGVSAMAAGRNR